MLLLYIVDKRLNDTIRKRITIAEELTYAKTKGLNNEMSTPKHIISAAAIVVNEKKEILLIKGPRRGWEMPGGQVEEGESLSQAAIRETKEESGIDIEIIKFCGIFQNVENSICNTLFLASQLVGN